MNTKVLAIVVVLILVGGGGMMYLYNSNNEINSGGQIPYSPDLPNLENVTEVIDREAYQITTPEGLVNFSVLSNSNTDHFRTNIVYLANDLDMSEIDNFVPINFDGYFYGQGHTISNLKISSDGLQYVGLFGYLRGSVHDLGIVDSQITATKNSGALYVGGFAGYMYAAFAKIENCYFSGIVSASPNSNSAYSPCMAGGIAGYLSSSAGIWSCYNLGSVTASTGNNLAYAGGIAGYVNRDSDGSQAEVHQCYNLGAVSASSGESKAAYAGGVAGYVTVTNHENMVRNTYYLDSSTPYAYQNASGSSSYKYTTGIMTSEELRNIDITLLAGYVKDEWNINNGYPILEWQAPELYAVSFDSNGGSEVESQSVYEGEKAVKPADPVKDNKVFYYWKDSNGQEYNFNTIVSSDLKLTAEWYDKLIFVSSPPAINNKEVLL